MKGMRGLRQGSKRLLGKLEEMAVVRNDRGEEGRRQVEETRTRMWTDCREQAQKGAESLED